MIDLKAFLTKKPKDTKGLRVSLLLILLAVTLFSIKFTEASNSKASEVATLKPVAEVAAEPEKPVPAPTPFEEAKAPAPAVVTQTPPKSQVKSQVKPKTTTSTSKPAAQKRTAATPSRPSNSDQISTSMTTSGITSQINFSRRASGLGNVALNSQLSAAALAKAKHMADNNYFAHTAPDGTDDFYFVNNSGYGWTSAGVNLAMGSFGDAKGLVDAWMNSEGHRKNILAPYGKSVGIGIYGNYYVMIIAN